MTKQTPRREPPHECNHNGSCWSSRAVYECRECGYGLACDVCHKCEEPRGECECAPCPVCAT